ncbi:MAG: hypothetical protein QOK37_3653 [Thermoanaerobaculia bacterium]|jgi:putative ABC transport system permease protein|nr:hypothetical protein [Thermoanaerobaculia bacterium]
MIPAIDYALYEAMPFVPMALGLVLTLRYLKFIDLASATCFALGPAVMARLLVEGHSPLAALLAAVLLTVAVSGLSSFLMTGIKLDPLLAGVVSSYVGYSLALLFTRGSLSLLPRQNPFTAIVELDFPHSADGIPLHPWSIATFAFIVLILKWLIDRFLDSEMGLAFRAMEDSRSAENVLPALGLSPAAFTTCAIIASSVLAMTSGIMIALKEGQANAQRGFDALISVVAAFLIGATIFERRPIGIKPRQKILKALAHLQRLRPSSAAVAGVLVYFTLIQAVASFDLPQSAPRLILAAILILVLLVTRASAVRRWFRGRQVGETLRVPPGEPFVGERICVTYPGYPEPNVVLTDASVSVRPGELFRLQGPNGSGKTTLLRFLAGEIEGAGCVKIPCDSNDTTDRRQLVAYVNQDAARSTISTLTISEHLSMFRQKGRRSWFARPKYQNEDVPFTDIPAGVLSGGQRQLLNLACVRERATPPLVILLDEPFNHLDNKNAEACEKMITDFAKAGRSVILVRHAE